MTGETLGTIFGLVLIVAVLGFPVLLLAVLLVEFVCYVVERWQEVREEKEWREWRKLQAMKQRKAPP